MAPRGALVEPSGSHSPVSAGWKEVLLKVSEGSNRFLGEPRDKDVTPPIFSDH